MPGNSLSLVWNLIATDEASPVFARVGAAADRTAAQTEAASAAVGGAFGKAAKAASVGAAAFAVVAVKMAADFQTNVTKLATTAGESYGALKSVGDGMLDMAGKVGIGANELAKGMYTIESSGIHGANALVVLKSAAEGAKQEGADLTHVADALSTVLHDYSLPAGKAADVTSMLVDAVAHGKTTFDELTASLHSVTPLAAALHVPLADILGSLSAMTASGESADQATQNMADALRHLQSPTATMTAELAQLGINSADLAQDLGTKGLAGTMQEIEKAILDHIDPATKKVLLPAFNESQTAAQDLQIMLSKMPPALQKLSQGLLDGSVSFSDYRKQVRDMGGDASAMGQNFLSLQQRADGFNSILKAGGPAAQVYSSALQKAVGDSAGLTVALQLTGEHAAATNVAIQDIAHSTAQADGNIKGWSEVQGNFNQQLSEFGEAVGSAAIQAGQHLLPALTGLVGFLNDRVIPGVKAMGSGVGDAVRWWQQLPAPIKDVSLAFAGLAIASKIGLLGALATGVQRVGTSFAAAGAGVAGLGAEMTVQQRLAAMEAASLTEVDRALGGMTVAANGAATSLTRAQLMLRGWDVALAETVVAEDGATASTGRLSAAMATLQARGMSAVRTGATGLVNAFGGPWGVAIAGAVIGVTALSAAFEKEKQRVADATQQILAWKKAQDEGGQAAVDGAKHLDDLQKKIADLNNQIKNNLGSNQADIQLLKEKQQALAAATKEYNAQRDAMTPLELAQERVNAAQATLNMLLKDHLPTSREVVAAADALRGAQDKLAWQQGVLNQVEKTHIQILQEQASAELTAVNSALGAQLATQQLSDAVTQYNADAKAGTLSTSQLAAESNQLAQQAYQAAQAAAQQAADQAKANGRTDDGTLANQAMLASLRASAMQITGPGHDALMQMIAALEKTTVETGNTTDAVAKMGLQVVRSWSDGTREVANATAQQIADLQNLGFNVTHLPNGHITVTADTGPAAGSLNALVQHFQEVNFGSALHARAFAAGGYTGDGGKYTPAGIVHAGEFVFPQEAVQRIGVGNLGELAGLPGYAGGGLVGLQAAERSLGGTWQALLRYLVSLTSSGATRYNAALQAAYNHMFPPADAFTGGFSGGGGSMRALGQQIAAAMGYASQFSAIDYIFTHESGWNPNAQNPTSTAYGIPQFLNSTWGAYGGKTSNPSAQIRDGIEYMVNRYGSPNAAAAFWRAHHWYDGGGWLPPGATLAMNGTGRPERVRTAAQEAALQQQLSSQPAVFHLYDVDGALIGTMRGVAQQEADGALATAATRARRR